MDFRVSKGKGGTALRFSCSDASGFPAPNKSRRVVQAKLPHGFAVRELL